MEKHKLDDLVTFTSGILKPRITDLVDESFSSRMIYNPLAEIATYVHGSSELPVITESQVAISLLRHEAYLVEKYPKVNEQILTAGFAAATLDDRLNRRFFVWWFNHSVEAQKQLEATGQLSRRIVLKDLRNIIISLPSPELQEDVGRLYEISRNEGESLRQKATLIEEMSLQFIRQKIIEEG